MDKQGVSDCKYEEFSTHGSLLVEYLPTYTSERYYLLSELEQLVQFVELRAMITQGIPTEGLILLYSLWSREIEVSEANLNCLDQLYEKNKKIIILVETFLKVYHFHFPIPSKGGYQAHQR